jgi:hypothetical protein
MPSRSRNYGWAPSGGAFREQMSLPNSPPSLYLRRQNFYPSLIMVRDQGRSIVSPEGLLIWTRAWKTAFANAPIKCGPPWLRARPSGAALACGRTGTVGDIDGSPRRQTTSEEEPTVVRTFEDRQNARAGWLTPRISPEMDGPVRRRLRSPGDPAAEETDHWRAGVATRKPTPP